MGKGKDGDCTISMMTMGIQDVLEGVRSLGLPAAYQVGGSVRDQILGQPLKDIDIAAAGLTPEELLSICNAAGKAEPLRVGQQLVGVRLWADWAGPDGVEIALLRTEQSTGSGHADFHIQPIPLPFEISALPIQQRDDPRLWQEMVYQDALRRDFTCNALFRDINSGEIIDPLGGLGDLSKNQLRVVHPQSFQDDPLRLLRMMVRVSKNGMTIESETEMLAKKWASHLVMDGSNGAVSSERVQTEVVKILAGPNSSKAWGIMRDTGMISGIMPEWQECIGFEQQSKYHSLSVDQHILQALSHADREGFSEDLKLAVLMHDIGKPRTAKPGKDGGLQYYGLKPNHPMWKTDPQRAQSHEQMGEEMTRHALNRMRFPAETTGQVAYLVRHHMFSEEREFSERAQHKQDLLARRMLHRHGPERSELLLQLRECDLAGKSQDKPGPLWNQDVQLLRQTIAQQKDNPYRLSHLAIDGSRLQELGLQPGPRTGDILNNLLKQVVGEPGLNTAERLDKMALVLIQA